MFKYMANAVFTFRMFQMAHIQPAGAPPVMLPFSSRRGRAGRSPHDLRSSTHAPLAMANIKTMSPSVAVLLFLPTMLLACASTPNHGWPYSRLHPDLAHKVMHAKEAANPEQSPATSERVKVTIRAESGQEGEEITRWLNDNGLQFTLGFVSGWPEPGFRRWFQFGSVGENIFRASVPVLLLPELSWVRGVDYVEQDPPNNGH